MSREQIYHYYIPSVEAKDIYLASLSKNSNPFTNAARGYSLLQADGQYRLGKFINSLDYSLDLLSLEKQYYKKYRNHRFGFQMDGKHYSIQVMNITFQYSVKDWNPLHYNTYIKLGYQYEELTFQDGIAKNEEGEIVGIMLDTPVEKPVNESMLAPYFSVKNLSDADLEHTLKENAQEQNNVTVYTKCREPKMQLSTAWLRQELYENGFICNGVPYVRLKRSSGSARVGKCLFINKALYKPMHKYALGGLTVQSGQEIDLAALEAYISLPTSSIIDTITIQPENILIIDDYESVFTEKVIATSSHNGWLETGEATAEISNSIWDGQSLLDISLFGKYANYGMVLLRNLMFKSCCFNCHIQKWFRDHNITQINQLNGYTIATSVEQIKLITTPSSIKYLKFSTWKQWLKHLYPKFGIVKHDKKTHFFEGNLVQTHYQLLNTLQLSKEEMNQFLQPSLNFAQMLRDNPAVVRYYIKYPQVEKMCPVNIPMKTKNDVVHHLLCVNDKFTMTKYYQEFLHDLLASYYKKLKLGHVLVHGNYSTLLGNPVEMLQQAIGTFRGKSQLGKGNIHCPGFSYGQILLGCRSPHITMGNLWLPYNKEDSLIDCYFHLTSQIVCVNSIGENVLARLSGADFDSDTVLLTDNAILIEAAKRNYNAFLTPTSFVSARKIPRCYTPAQQADLDIKISVNLIGEIINLSQELNSLLWDKMYQGCTYSEVEPLYFDICQLDIMSGIEIDKAKKEFDVDNKRELQKIRKKYENSLTDEQGRRIMPHFFSHIARQKGYYDSKKTYMKKHTSMDYLNTIVNSFKVKHPYKKELLSFTAMLDSRLYRTSSVNQKQINRIYSYLLNYKLQINKCYQSDHSKEDKFALRQLYKEQLMYSINKEKIGFSTLFCLLSSLEHKENRAVKNILLEILFQCKNASFNKAILSSAEEVEQIELIQKISNPNTSLYKKSTSDTLQENYMEIFHLPFQIRKKKCQNGN